MHPSSNTAAARPDLATALPALLLAGGALNGFAARVMEQLQQAGGGLSLFMGVSPFEVIAAAIGTHLLLKAGTQSVRVLIWPEFLLLALLLVPSSTVSWLAVAAYALFLAARSAGDMRLGALLFLLLALAAIWGSVLLRWLALPITSFEAHTVWFLTSVLRDDLTVVGNVIGRQDGHQLIVLAACSSAEIVPKALLALVAVAAFLEETAVKPLVWLGAALAVLITLANWIRLAVMSWSPEMFEIAHGPLGANLFDVVQTSLLVAAGLILCRR